MTVLYPTDSVVVAPNVPTQKASTSATQQQAIGICKNQDSEFRIPNRDELASIFVNQILVNGAMVSGATNYWSATVHNATYGWTQGMLTGGRLLHLRNSGFIVQCVKR